MRSGIVFAALATGALSACAGVAPQGLPPVGVQAVAETAPVGTENEDAADDPAIWRNAADPAASLIVATDKKAGLYVYDLDGAVKGFVDAGAVNNVDLVDTGDRGVIVAASDRNDLATAKLQFFHLDTASAQLKPLATLTAGPGEGYGVCLSWRDGVLMVYSPVKQGTIYEQRVVLDEEISVVTQRVLNVPSQPEGCVVDPRDGTLYVGEEAGGIWRFDHGATEGKIVAPVDNNYLVADVEGLALVPEGETGGWLVASSQGDNAYAVFSLPDMAPLGRFAIVQGIVGSTQETDGIELVAGDFGVNYPAGLFVAQDGQNAPAAQNFKLVSWSAIKMALGLK